MKSVQLLHVLSEAGDIFSTLLPSLSLDGPNITHHTPNTSPSQKHQSLPPRIYHSLLLCFSPKSHPTPPQLIQSERLTPVPIPQIQLPLLNDSPATTNPYQPLPLQSSSHHEPLDHDNDRDLENPNATDPLLPRTRFTPQTLLGGRNSSSSSSSSGGDREVLGHLLASLIAGIITERDRDRTEERVLLLGLGLDSRCLAADDHDGDEARREVVKGIMELVREVV